jgi:hypothetical protein
MNGVRKRILRKNMHFVSLTSTRRSKDAASCDGISLTRMVLLNISTKVYSPV